MPQQQTVRVLGLRELNRAFQVADKSYKKRWRAEQKSIGAPVAALAQELAISRVSGLQRSPSWSQMRVGVTTRVVYVAPKSRNRGGRKRPNLGSLLMTKAMLPALAANEQNTLRAVDGILYRMGEDWEHA